jgi:hypothetical protein
LRDVWGRGDCHGRLTLRECARIAGGQADAAAAAAAAKAAKPMKKATTFLSKACGVARGGGGRGEGGRG